MCGDAPHRIGRHNGPMSESQRLASVIAQLEAQRATLGDVIVDAATQPLRAQLAALHSAATEQTLRQVSVLFTDVVGSTTLSERLDPEDIHAVMDGALDRFSAIVRAHGGRVLQYAGDSMLGVFGADKVLEDDAERAVRAGLAILDEALAQGVAVERRYRHRGFAVRVGISTGGVLLGGGVDGDGTIRGITVNVAARMEQSAPTGSLHISHDTYRHVRGVFDVAEQPPANVKGIAQPVRSYLVLRAKPRAFRPVRRGIEGLTTALIGREPELARLTAAFETVISEQRLVALSIVGDAGLGKSRLLESFDQWLELRPETIWLFYGRARPQGHDGPFGVLRDLLAWRFEIQDSDVQAVAQAKLTKGLGALFGERADEQSALVGQLIGLDCSASPHIAGITTDARQIRDRGFHALAEFFRLLHQSDGAPIALLLDDLHWADDGSLDWLTHLLRHCADVPILVLCLARPLLYERRPGWGAEARVERVQLAPLAGPQAQALAEALLERVDDVPQSLRDLLAGSAEGNPFFIEELVGMLIDDGVIETDTERWRVLPERLAGLKVPPTLTGVLQARLDSLPGAEKSALQEASVIGPVFWDDALRRIEASAPLALDSLAHRELARYHDTTAFEGAREFGFKHHLLHQVTYESVLRRHKREQHRLTAEWLIERSGDRIGEYHGLVAMHYERADDVPNALLYLRKAADDAARTYENDAALQYLRRALALTDGSAESLHVRHRFALLRSRAEVLASLGRRAESGADIEAMEALAEQLDDDALRARAAAARATHAVFTSDYPGAAAAAERAVCWAAAAGVSDVDMSVRAAWSGALRNQGDYAGGRHQAELMLAAARAAGNRKQEASALNNLAGMEAEQGRSRAAYDLMTQSLAIALATGDRSHEALARSNLGVLGQSIGAPDAEQQLQLALQVIRQIGHLVYEGGILGNLAGASCVRGRHAEGLVLAHEALAIERHTRHRNSVGYLLCLVGHCEVGLGHFDAARVAYDEAAALFAELGMSAFVNDPRAGLARTALAQGRLDEALVQVAQISAHLDGGGNLDGNLDPDWIYLSCYQVLAAAARPRALEFLEAAHGIVSRHLATLDDADRAAFLAAAPVQREILTAWERTLGPR